MLCKNCGKEFDSENKVCPYCSTDNNVSNSPNVESVETLDTTPETKPEVSTVPVVENKVEESVKPVVEEIENLIEPVKEEKVENLETAVQEEKLVIEEPTAEPKVETLTEPVSEEKVETTIESAATNTPTETKPEVTTNNDVTMTIGGQSVNTSENNSDLTPTKKNNTRLIIMFILIAVLAVVAFLVNKPADDKSTNNTNNNETNANNNTNNNVNNNSNSTGTNTDVNKTNTLLSYSGVYTNGKYEIIITASTRSSSEMLISPVTTESLDEKITMELDGYILVNDDFFSEYEEDIRIEKTADGINITASTTNTNSKINDINGSYTKKNVVTKNWTGYYKNDKLEVIIDESDGANAILIVEGEKDGTFISYISSYDNYTEQKIYDKDTSFGKTKEITIEKTADGIKLTASSTEPDDLDNQISGIYSKAN